MLSKNLIPSELRRAGAQMYEDEEGATVIEYAMMASLIAAVCAAIVGILGLHVQGLFTRLNDITP